MCTWNVIKVTWLSVFHVHLIKDCMNGQEGCRMERWVLSLPLLLQICLRTLIWAKYYSSDIPVSPFFVFCVDPLPSSCATTLYLSLSPRRIQFCTRLLSFLFFSPFCPLSLLRTQKHTSICMHLIRVSVDQLALLCNVFPLNRERERETEDAIELRGRDSWQSKEDKECHTNS